MNHINGSFSLSSVLTYSIRSFLTLPVIKRTVEHLWRYIEELTAMHFAISVVAEDTLRDSLMNQLRLFAETSYKVSTAKVVKSKNDSL